MADQEQKTARLLYENEQLKRQVGRLQDKIEELKIRLNEESTRSVEYRVAWEGLQKRQRELASQLDKLSKIYPKDKLTVRSHRQHSRLIQNKFNFDSLTGKQYEKQIQHYAEKGSSDDDSQPEDASDPEAKKQKYYKQLLQEMREELVTKNRKIKQQEDEAATLGKEIKQLKQKLQRTTVELQSQLKQHKQNYTRILNEQQKSKQHQERKQIISSNQERIVEQKAHKLAQEAVRKVREEISQVRKQLLQKEAGTKFIKQQYQKHQEIFSKRQQQYENNISQLNAIHRKEIKAKNKEITMLKASLKKVQDQVFVSTRKKQKSIDASAQREVVEKQNIQSKEQKYAPYLEGSKSKKKSETKVRATKAQQEQESELKTIKELKQEMKRIQKLIDKAKP